MTTPIEGEDRRRNSLGQRVEDYDIFRQLERRGLLKDYGQQTLQKNNIDMQKEWELVSGNANADG